MSAAAAPVPARLAGEARPLLHDPVFISDLHLCADRPATLARFQALLSEIAGHAAEAEVIVLRSRRAARRYLAAVTAAQPAGALSD